MRRFIFLIGHDDEFSNGWHLIQSSLRTAGWAIGDLDLDCGASKYAVELPADLKLQGYNNLHEIAYSILLGEAMKDSWCLDDVFDVLLESTGGELRVWEGGDEWTPVPSDAEMDALV